MAFSSQQVRKLKSRLKPQHVRLREVEGQNLHYLEGWHVVAEANRIFGFDGWDRETVSNTCVWTRQIGGRYCAAYVARVRITVRAGDATIIREGSGAGESNEPTPGQAHDRASKAAETDATKRALTTFGNCFGLTLYAGGLEAERRLARAQKGDGKPSAEQASPVSARPDHARHDGGVAVPDNSPVTIDDRLAGATAGNGQEHQLGKAGASRADAVLGDRPVMAGDARTHATAGNGWQAGNGGQDPEGFVASNAAIATRPKDGELVVASHDGDQAVESVAASEEPPASARAVVVPAASGPGLVANGHPADTSHPADDTPHRRAIDKSLLTIAEPRRVRDPEHLRFVAEQPCMLCGRQPCEAHHLRYVQPRALGRKSSDAYTVPLCALHHRELHAKGNERAWWIAKGRDPVAVADQLWRQSSGRSAVQPQPAGVYD